MSKKKVIVTGSCGFIGHHLVKELKKKYYVIGIDNLNNYYDVSLKQERLKYLRQFCTNNDYQNHYQFIELNIAN